MGYGGVSSDLEIKRLELSEKEDQTGVTYGGGIGFMNSDDVILGLEYLSLFDGDGSSIEGLSLSFSFPF